MDIHTEGKFLKIVTYIGKCRDTHVATNLKLCLPQTSPTVGTRTTLDSEIKTFLSKNPDLHLGDIGDLHNERAHHTKVFGFHSLPSSMQAPIHFVEFTSIRGPHGTIPIRVFYPKSGEERRKYGDASALIYFHGGGYTVGMVDEFENGLRIVTEEAGVQVYAVEYRLAPESRFPTQLDEYIAVVEWVQGKGGKVRGVSSKRVMGGGDDAGGNMTAAVCLRMRDEGMKPFAAQVLLYPETRLPFDTDSVAENNSGLYLECKSPRTHWASY
jgi:acetyl esterase/lipase